MNRQPADGDGPAICLWNADLTFRASSGATSRLFDMGDYAAENVPAADAIRAALENCGRRNAAQVEAALNERLKAMELRQYRRFSQVLADGSVIDSHWMPLPDGGYITLFSTLDVGAGASIEQAFTSQIVDSALDFFAVISPDYVYQRLNGAYEDAIGQPASALVGRHIADLVGKETFEEFIKERFDRAAAGETLSHCAWFDFPVSGRRYLSIRLFPLLDDNGAVESVAVIGRDITDIRETARALEASEQKFRNLVDGSVQGVMVHRDGRVVYANRSFADIHGYTPEQLDGMDVSCLATDEENERFAELRQLERVYFEYQGICRDGSRRWLEGVARSFDWDGEPARLVTVVDATAERAAQDKLRQAQKMEAVGQLTGGVAHDFNNLLMIVQGNLEFLEESGRLDDNLARHAASALKAARRGAALTQRLLAFSRKQILAPKRVDINSLIREMADLLGRSIGETINVELSLADDIWPIFIDPGQLENALVNLVVNGRDAMPHGGRIEICTANLEARPEDHQLGDILAPGDYVVLRVSDSGEGMSAEVLGKAFEPFYTTKAVGAGSGLGLSTIFGFVKQSGGHIDIDSAPGKGTTVFLYLPRTDRFASKPAEASFAPNPRGDGQTILVVEDDNEVRALAADVLQGLGYRTLEAADADGALGLLRSDIDIGLLFTDIVLPGGVNGRVLAEQAQALKPHLPVLYTSGYTQDILNRETGGKADFELIEKPYRRADLAASVRRVLSPENVA